MGLYFLVICRVGCLTGERIFFHYLGEKRNGLATTLVAFGGAAALLWIAAVCVGPIDLVGGAFWPSLIYAAHFALYTTAFGMGSVSTVSPWTNLTVLLLFLWAPAGGLLAWAGLGAFGIGMWLLVGRHPTHWTPVLAIVAASLLLAVARLADVGRSTGPALAYAASMYTWVSLWIGIVVLVAGRTEEVAGLLRERPLWSLFSAGANAASYITLVLLIRELPLAGLESLGSVAALAATLIGSFWLKEPAGKRKIMASWLMSGGALALLWDHLAHARLGL